MIDLKQQTRQISKLLPKIARNLRIAPLVDEVKPGLTTSQLMVLLILKDSKGTMLSMGKLAQELAVSLPSVSGIIERLHREKLVERSHSRKDRRLVLVKLTDTGEKITEKLLNAFEKLLFDILEKMSKSERETVSKAIGKVLEFSITLSKENYNKDMLLPKTA